MFDAEGDRSRAAARLEAMAPSPGDGDALRYEELVAMILAEARQRGLGENDELLSTALDAIARRYFGLFLRSCNHDHASKS
ncbi:hypothetical protein JQ604_09425 [Bradyrhizobium jicamae]|uniref:hypothetical protein n=1 Tax=Bradyrhizobium jicamae TaxID=280332 RepID=UPI001BA8E9A1|nr:hypothetical protein [Bradyrhizobium jicamae]MBR0752404.1 hypothetical protein [Bradyrhizobium jicamae]